MKSNDISSPNQISLLQIQCIDLLLLEKNLKVMDPAAISLCRENHIPIIVLNIFTEGKIEKALEGEQVGTLITE